MRERAPDASDSAAYASASVFALCTSKASKLEYETPDVAGYGSCSMRLRQSFSCCALVKQVKRDWRLCRISSCSSCVSICAFVPVKQVNWAPSARQRRRAAALRGGPPRRPQRPTEGCSALQLQQRHQYVYVCTSKASKVSTQTAGLESGC